MERKASPSDDPCSTCKRQKTGATASRRSEDEPPPEVSQKGAGDQDPSAEGGHGEEVAKDSGTEEDSSCYYDSEDSDIEGFFYAKARLEAILERQANEDDEEEAEDDDDSCESESSSSYGPWEEFCARVQMINHAVNQHFQAKEVKGNHRSVCLDCGNIPSFGFYAVDQSGGVYDAPKLCEECVQSRSEALALISEDRRKYLKVQTMRSKLEEQRVVFLDPFAPGGLFEVGPDAPFRLSKYGSSHTAPKIFKDHMKNCKRA